MSENHTATLPLDGIRALDFTSMVSGPYCTRLLADMGATVIKIESHSGDLLRYAAPMSEAGSRYFQIFNAGKQSLTLDLKSSEGVAMATEIARNSDISREFQTGCAS
jgi:CoA:oxalate CoA-transferase